MRIQQRQQARGRAQTRKLSSVAATILALAITVAVMSLIALAMNVLFSML